MRQSFLITILTLFFVTAMAETLPMPPRFTPDTQPQALLRTYPLGVINKMGAFAHHGQPDHKITLPNGLEGWIYEVYGDRDAVTYVEPSGTEHEVRETTDVSPRWSYTLVFGTDDKVIDVLYNGKHPRFGLSALQVQRRADPMAQKLPSTEHGPHFPPGSARERY